jgi:hypothetical protein
VEVFASTHPATEYKLTYIFLASLLRNVQQIFGMSSILVSSSALKFYSNLPLTRLAALFHSPFKNICPPTSRSAMLDTIMQSESL